MNLQNRRLLLAGAVVLGLLSLPMTWMTIHNAQISGGMFSMPGMSLDVTGLNGHVTLLVKTPLWFVVSVIVAAAVAQWMHFTGTITVPRPLAAVLSIAGLGWVGLAIVISLASSQASLGLGALIALAAAVMTLISVIKWGDSTNDLMSRDEQTTVDGE
ncbi:MAG: hypothetical protein Fues2KO_01050 [Fuerstiella sp.]